MLLVLQNSRRNESVGAEYCNFGASNKIFIGLQLRVKTFTRLRFWTRGPDQNSLRHAKMSKLTDLKLF
jgi:hypothetical protein